MKSLAGAFPRSEAGLEPSLPISQDSSHPGLDSCAGETTAGSEHLHALSLAFTPCSSLGSSAKEEAWTWPSDPLASFQHTVDPLSTQLLLGEMA